MVQIYICNLFNRSNCSEVISIFFIFPFFIMPDTTTQSEITFNGEKVRPGKASLYEFIVSGSWMLLTSPTLMQSSTLT